VSVKKRMSELGHWTTSDDQHKPVWSTICGWLSANVHAQESTTARKREEEDE